MYELTPTQTNELRNIEGSIRHSRDTLAYISNVAIIGVTGPSAIGTTSIINESGLYKVPGFTTRPPRHAGEGGIRFVKHSRKNVDACIEKAKSGELIQVKLSPEGFVYGTETEDYVIGEPNVVDMHARSILDLGALKFKSLTAAYVVSPAVDWVERFEHERGAFHENADRLWSDLESLLLTEENYGNLAFLPIINERNKVAESAVHLKCIAAGFEVDRDYDEDAGHLRSKLIAEMSTLV